MSGSPACARNLALDRRLDVFRGFPREAKSTGPEDTKLNQGGLKRGENCSREGRKVDQLGWHIVFKSLFAGPLVLPSDSWASRLPDEFRRLGAGRG